MTATATNHPILASADAFAGEGRFPACIAALRQRGADAFERLGLPTTRDEEWRLTNVAPIGKTNWALPEPADVGAEALERFLIPGLDAYRLVFIDGHFAPEHTLLPGKPGEVTIGSLAEHYRHDEALIAPHLAQYATPESDAFVALNTAYLRDGVFIHVPQGVKLDKPVFVLFLSTDAPQPTMTHPRVLVLCDDHTKVDVIEHHVATSDSSVYFTNAVTEILVGEKAEVSHYFIERDSRNAYNVSTLQVQQRRESRFASHSVLVGGKVVRNNVRPVIAGDHCWSLLNGLYLPDGDRVIDNHMYVHHQAPNCDSRQYYTGVLRDQSTGIFIGRIKVERPAQKTDAVQSSRNLLMTEGTHAHNRPQLEIFADDVKCTHGSTTGQIDEPSIFYLRSRGVPEEVARGMLVFAFANESFDRMEIEPVRRELAKLLVNELSLGSAVENVIE